MSPKRALSANDTFLQAIRAEPDEDAHRLIYADWLEETGDPNRAEFIRVQCRLACTADGDPTRPALAAREAELLDAHGVYWTDLAFVSWLGHSRGTCRNLRKHGFCTTVAEGLRAHLVLNACLPGDCKRAQERLKIMEQRMVSRYNYQAATCRFGVWYNATFRRGFIEEAQVYPYMVELFADALAELGVLRRLVIDDEEGDAEAPLTRLVEVLHRIPLLSLECRAFVTEEGFDALAGSAHFPRLTDLNLMLYVGEYGDEAVEQIAGSPAVAGLRSLVLKHINGFTDRAVRAVLDSPHLSGLRRFELTGIELDLPMALSEPLQRECTARFGTKG